MCHNWLMRQVGETSNNITLIKILPKRLYGGQWRVFYLCRCGCGAEFELANTSFAQQKACKRCSRIATATKGGATRRGQKRTEKSCHKMSTARKAYYIRIGGYPESVKEKQRQYCGERLYNWKGDGASYAAIHNWVRCWLGKPDTCESCGASGLTGRHIHWANMSGLYKRDVSDWKRMCAGCHRKYDVRMGLGSVKKRFPLHGAPKSN